MKIRTMLSAAALAVSLSGLAMADVTGKISYEGKAVKPKKIDMSGVPQCHAANKDTVFDQTIVIGKDKGLANVVISIKNPPAGGKVPAEPAVLTQKNCMYTPHVLPMMVGQKIKVANGDAWLHNVHGLPEENKPFNFGQNNVDPGKDVPPMAAVENFRVKCDVHPWMSAWFAVFDHPYFATSDADGKFAIKGLKDGEYEVTAWHEKLGTVEGKVTVKGEKGEVNLTIKAEEDALAEPAGPIKTVSLPSLTGEAKACCKKESAVK